MSAYGARLAARQQKLGRPVRVGLVGAGQMGTGLVAQVGRIPGMSVAAIADVDTGRAERAYAGAGVAGVVSGDDPDRLASAVEEGRPVAVGDAELLTGLPVDFVVEATGVPEVGARVAFAALLAGKDVGLLNVECDITVGYLLTSLARRGGQVYTVCRGDEPAEAKRLVDYARDLAFEVVCAGKGKNNPMDVTSTPDSLAAEAAEKGMNPKMLCSFVDGSKAMIEMAALANATGLEVSTRGMHGPATTVDGLAEVYRPVAEGGILDRAGVVDYCTGPVAPGVFAVVRSDDRTVIDEMRYLKMGPGPYFTLYRPYHLASIEAPLSIAEAVLDRTPSLQPDGWRAEVCAAAKRDLAAGDRIDGIGGHTVYGIIESAAAAGAENLVPIGLLAGARMVRPVPQGKVLTWADVEVDETSTLAHLRRLQDRMLAGESVASAA
ncbi:MAG: NAD(P)H-dependent oxidoreductase [Mycobacteriales bacterium]